MTAEHRLVPVPSLDDRPPTEAHAALVLERYVTAIRDVGPGYHPDTAPEDYVLPVLVYTALRAAHRDMDRFLPGVDRHALALEALS